MNDMSGSELKSALILSKQTLIPIGIAISLFAVVAGGASWVTNSYRSQAEMNRQVESLTVRLNNVELRQFSQEKEQTKTEERLSNIERLLTELASDVKKLLTARS